MNNSTDSLANPDIAQSDTVVSAFNNGAHAYGAPGVIDSTYEVQSLIGRGGMGAVYRCRHNILNKEYAVKLLTCDSLDNPNWARFQLEARALARLNHPGVVGIHNMGIDQESGPYFVMDLIDGRSLADLLAERGKLPQEPALEIFKQLADALCAAHQQGIIHRDIKPSNIMVSAVGQDRLQVKLVDFGLARVARQDGGNLTLTAAGTVFGTPLYMSPEQAMGLKVDGRSDIYSLGCVFYEILTGVPPFRGATAMATLMLHQTEIAPPVSRSAPVAAALEKIIARMLSRSLSARYGEMQEVRRDLLNLECDSAADYSPVSSSASVSSSSLSSGLSLVQGLNSPSNFSSSANSSALRDRPGSHSGNGSRSSLSQPGKLLEHAPGILLGVAAAFLLLVSLGGILFLPKFLSSGDRPQSGTLLVKAEPAIDDFGLDGDVGISLERNFRSYLAAHPLLCTRIINEKGQAVKRFEFPDFAPSVLDSHNLGYLLDEAGRFHRLTGRIDIPADDRTYLYLQVACQDFPTLFRWFGFDNLAGLEVVTNDVPQVIASLKGARGLTHLSFFNSLERSPGFDCSVLLKEHVPLLNSLEGINSLGLCGQLYVGKPAHGEEFTGADAAGLKLLPGLNSLALQEIRDLKPVLKELEHLPIRKFTVVRCRLSDEDVRLICRCRTIEELTLFQNEDLSPGIAESLLTLPRLRRLIMDNEWDEPVRQKFARKIRFYKFENYRANRKG